MICKISNMDHPYGVYITVAILIVIFVDMFRHRHIGGGRPSKKIKNVKNHESLRMQDPWLYYIQTGKKTIIGRSGSYKKFARWIGKDIYLYNNKRRVLVHVLNIHWYPDLNSFLTEERWWNVLPDPSITSFKQAKETHNRWYSDDHIEKAGGMCGILVRLAV